MEFWKVVNEINGSLRSPDTMTARTGVAQLEAFKGVWPGRDRIIEKIQDYFDDVVENRGAPEKRGLPETTNGASGGHVTISFATSVYNRFWQLRHTLPVNLAAIREAGHSELVLVDFGGQDSEELREYLERYFPFEILSGILKYYQIKTSWKSFDMATAKNCAIRLSRMQFVMSLDADNYLTLGDIDHLNKTFTRFPDAIVQHATGPAPMKHEMWAGYDLFPREVCHRQRIEWNGSAGRIACSRDLYEKINGYNESLTGMGMDDIDFLIRAIRSGAEYIHRSPSRAYSEIFIENEARSGEEQHDNNEANWKTMDDFLSTGGCVADYEPREISSNFNEYKPKAVSYSAGAKVTLFSSVHAAERFIDRFAQDIREIIAGEPTASVWLMDVVGSHSNWVSDRLRKLAAEYACIFYFPVYFDPGLYECWNRALRWIQSNYVANLNSDDVRGREWLPACLDSLERDLCDVSSPLTVPFTDVSSESYDGLLEKLRKREAETVWFDTAVDYLPDTDEIHRRDHPAGYFDHTDLFQVSHDRDVASYCIPNASSVWRRALHDRVGYFDEKMYGAFTDLAFWMKASKSGYMLRQNDYRVLFLIHDDQAHRRQDSQSLMLKKLAIEYGSDAYRKLATKNVFDLRMNKGSFGAHHLRGWDWVRDQLLRTMSNRSDGIVLDLFVERTFFWWSEDPNREFIHRERWAGFVHTTPHTSKAYSLQAQNLDHLVEEPRFVRSLEKCVGLFVLSEQNRRYLKGRLEAISYPNIPVYGLFHPNIPVPKAPLGEQGVRRDAIYHVGAHLRSFAAFARLNVPRDKKVLLVPGSVEKAEFIENVVNRELAENGMGVAEEYFNEIFHAPADQYEAILREGVVFNYYIEPSGSNLISEAISAGTKLILNRHPAFHEYLPVDYPLFYETLEEAAELYRKILSDNEFVDSVAHYYERVRRQYSIDQFIRLFERCTERMMVNMSL